MPFWPRLECWAGPPLLGNVLKDAARQRRPILGRQVLGPLLDDAHLTVGTYDPVFQGITAGHIGRVEGALDPRSVVGMNEAMDELQVRELRRPRFEPQDRQSRIGIF